MILPVDYTTGGRKRAQRSL